MSQKNKNLSIDYFLEIEEQYGLFQKEACGINFWIFERFDLWSYNIWAQRDNLTTEAVKKKTTLSKLIKEYLIIIKNCAFRGSFPRERADILFLNHSRKVAIDGLYHCIYTDELADIFTNSYTIEAPYFRDHLKPSYNKNIIYSDYIFSLGQIIGIINQKINTKKYKEAYNLIYNEINEPMRKLCEYYGVEIDIDTLSKKFAKNAIDFEFEKKAYRKIVNRINPKLVVEVVHYVSQSLLINEICSEKGIATVELQHGTIHSEHVGYRYKCDNKLSQLPNYIYSFSDYWNSIMCMPKECTKVVAVGYPYFEETANKIKNLVIKPEKKIILFLSQGTIGGLLFLLAKDLQEIIDSNRYKIVYKLHPSEYPTWREKYSKYASVENLSFEVVDSNVQSLYSLFAMSEIQVGVYSTSVYEGLGFNLETYIYNIARADTMSALVENGYAEYVNNAEELYSNICKEKKVNVDVNKFWKDNALKNIVDELKEQLA